MAVASPAPLPWCGGSASSPRSAPAPAAAVHAPVARRRHRPARRRRCRPPPPRPTARRRRSGDAVRLEHDLGNRGQHRDAGSARLELRARRGRRSRRPRAAAPVAPPSAEPEHDAQQRRSAGGWARSAPAGGNADSSTRNCSPFWRRSRSAATLASSRLLLNSWKLRKRCSYSRSSAASCSATRGVSARRSWTSSTWACSRSISWRADSTRSAARRRSASAVCWAAETRLRFVASAASSLAIFAWSSAISSAWRDHVGVLLGEAPRQRTRRAAARRSSSRRSGIRAGRERPVVRRR